MSIVRDGVYCFERDGVCYPVSNVWNFVATGNCFVMLRDINVMDGIKIPSGAVILSGTGHVAPSQTFEILLQLEIIL